jgi:hypothetical protein
VFVDGGTAARKLFMHRVVVTGLTPGMAYRKSFVSEIRSAECVQPFSDQTPEHSLQTCPIMTSRQHCWPEPTTLKTKLWGTADDL